MRFNQLLTQFELNGPTTLSTDSVAGIIDNYEFTAYVIPSLEGRHFALIEGADPSRAEEMDTILRTEVRYHVVGWCPLKECAEDAFTQWGAQLASSMTTEDLPLVTYYENHNPIWVILVEPVKQKSPRPVLGNQYFIV